MRSFMYPISLRHRVRLHNVNNFAKISAHTFLIIRNMLCILKGEFREASQNIHMYTHTHTYIVINLKNIFKIIVYIKVKIIG